MIPVFLCYLEVYAGIICNPRTFSMPFLHAFRMSRLLEGYFLEWWLRKYLSGMVSFFLGAFHASWKHHGQNYPPWAQKNIFFASRHFFESMIFRTSRLVGICFLVHFRGYVYTFFLQSAPHVQTVIFLCEYQGNPAVLCAAAMTSIFDPSLQPAAPMLLMSLAQKDSQVVKLAEFELGM